MHQFGYSEVVFFFFKSLVRFIYFLETLKHHLLVCRISIGLLFMGEYFRSVSHGVLRWFYYRWGRHGLTGLTVLILMDKETLKSTLILWRNAYFFKCRFFYTVLHADIHPLHKMVTEGIGLKTKGLKLDCFKK